jgi:hypothetical protein
MTSGLLLLAACDRFDARWVGVGWSPVLALGKLVREGEFWLDRRR